MRNFSSLILILTVLGCKGAKQPTAISPKTEAATPSGPSPLSALEAVDPFIGTGGHGHTFPGPTWPFGMMQLGPDTRLEGWDGCSGYHNSDSVIHGFSHTHLSGTGVSDYGDLLIMPDTGLVSGEVDKYASRFRKEFEHAEAGYYYVRLDDPGVDVELTTTARCGLHRYIFPEGSTPKVLIDLKHRDPVINSGLQVLGDTKVEGFRVSNAWAKEQHFYFSMEFSRPILGVKIVGAEGKRAHQGQSVVAELQFAPSPEPLLLRVGMSGVDVEGARRNLAAELPDFAFEVVVAQIRKEWEKQLAKIEVQGGSNAQRRVFYTALYHTMTAPNLWSDVDGRFRAMNQTIEQLAPGDEQYTVFSLWDTFRAAHPLYTLIETKRTGAFIRSFLRQSKHGLLPVWELAANETNCMIGYHSVSVIADAYFKGIRDFDPLLAFFAMRQSAQQDALGLRAYKQQGMIGAEDEPESVSKTLEYAYDDWCIALMAKAEGKEKDFLEFSNRAQNYKNLYDPGTGFFRARMNGAWMPRFDPHEVNFNFTEANAWQYSLFAPQDIGGLVKLHGGAKGFENHLDAMFNADSRTTGRDQADITGLIGQYAHGNEPSHHMAYLYMYCNAAPKTQALVRRILDELYTDQPDGLSGNEDCGQMSAWLVLSSLGFYPVTPGSPNYILGSPWFDALTLNLENGRQFKVIAEGNGKKAPFVRSLALNGQSWKNQWVSHEAIQAGGELRFTMAESPVVDFFGDPQLIPAYAMAGAIPVPIPYFEAAGQTFTDSMVVAIKSPDPSCRFRVSFDHLTPIGPQAPVYQGPITLHSDTKIVAMAESSDGRFSYPVTATYFKIDGSRSIQLKSKYANQYAAGGDKALIDRLRGGENFRTGRWQGYQEDLVAVVDLGKEQVIKNLRVGFLQDIGSWIWMPTEVEFLVSGDGKSFQSLGVLKSPVSDREYKSMAHDFVQACPDRTKARYIQLRAKNYGKCPAWHLGAGGTTWLFADEIEIE